MIKWIALGILAALVLLFIFLPIVAWILVGLALLVLAVVLLVPIGADIAYIDGRFSLAARVDGFAMQLLPKKPADPNKPPKEQKPKEEKKEPAGPEPEKKKRSLNLNFTKEELLELAKKAIRGLGKFGKLTIRKFMLHYTAAGEDPYNTAMLYGFVNTVLCTLAPLCARSFHIRGDVDVRTDVDFAAEKMRIDTEVSVTLRLIQVVHAGLAVAFGALGVLIRSKLRQRKEARLAKKSGEAVLNEEEQSDHTTTTEHEITKAEERNDKHG